MPPIPLEQRLATVPVSAASVEHAILHPGSSLAPGYLKDGFIHRITSYCTAQGIQTDPGFPDKLEQLTKEPLKVITYGAGKSRNIPQAVMNALTDWEKAYVFAGMDDPVRLQPNLSVAEQIATVLLQGISNVCRRHNQFKSRPTSYGQRKTYTTEPTAPYAADIGEDCRVTLAARSVKDIIQLMERERVHPDEELSHEIAVMLDRCSPHELRALKRRFGSAALGDYDPARLRKLA